MDPLTGDQLNEITARHAAATPGPWERYPEYGTDFYAYTQGEHLRGVGDLDFGADDASAGDRAFVEHAVTDMGVLLAEVRRLRAVDAAVLGVMEHYRDTNGLDPSKWTWISDFAVARGLGRVPEAYGAAEAECDGR